MKRTILEIYALAVCFVTVLCFSISFAVAIYKLIGVVNPAFTNTSIFYSGTQSLEKFKETHAEVHGLSDEEVEKRRQDDLRQMLQDEQHGAKQDFAWSVISMAVASLIFAVHWRLAKHARAA